MQLDTSPRGFMFAAYLLVIPSLWPRHVFAAEAEGSACTVAGQVRVAGKRTRLEGVAVIVAGDGDLEHATVVHTDETGRFAAAPGSCTAEMFVSTRMEGYVEQTIWPFGSPQLRRHPNSRKAKRARKHAEKTLSQMSFYLHPSGHSMYRTQVLARQKPGAPPNLSLDGVYLAQAAGGANDPLRAVQGLPSVTRAPFGYGVIGFRGSSSRDTAVLFHGHRLPKLYHPVGAFNTVIPTSALSSVGTIPSNFGAQYGRALGGLVELVPAQASQSGIEGYGDINDADISTHAKIKTKHAEIVLGLRRSWIDVLLRPVIASGESNTGGVLPQYGDAQLFLSTRLRSTRIDVHALAADDRFGGFIQSGFQHIDMVLRRNWRKWAVEVSPRYLRERSMLASAPDVKDREISHALGLRAHIRWQPVPGYRLKIGIDSQRSWSLLQLDSNSRWHQVANFSSNRLALANTWLPAAYAEMHTRIRRYWLQLSVRASHFASTPHKAGQSQGWQMEPRAQLGAQLTSWLRLSFHAGQFAQPIPTSLQFLQLAGNAVTPNNAPEKAQHMSFVLDAAKRLREINWQMQASFYYKAMQQLLPSLWWEGTQSSLFAPARWQSANAPRELGRAFGAELFGRMMIREKYFAQLSYSLSRSQRRPSSSDAWQLYTLDQPHRLAISGGAMLGRGFTASFRFRLTSGNPHYVCSETQETVVTETGAFGGGCVRARVLSSRGKAFHQLDLRLQKDWLLRRLKASLYLDVQNVYYHDNSEFIEQDANQMASAIDGLRIFPLFGFRVSY